MNSKRNSRKIALRHNSPLNLTEIGERSHATISIHLRRRHNVRELYRQAAQGRADAFRVHHDSDADFVGAVHQGESGGALLSATVGEGAGGINAPAEAIFNLLSIFQLLPDGH